MANDATNNRKENPTYQKFTDKILSLIDQITNEDWEQGWEKGKHIINTAPESIKERKYTGINTFALMLSQIANRYEVPVFMTFNQAKELGVQILPNSKGIPLMKANPYYWDKEKSTRVSPSDYEKMSETEKENVIMKYGTPTSFTVFNISQTDLITANKEKYDAIVSRFQPYIPTEKDTEGMYKNAELDRMVEKDEWECKFNKVGESNRAYYSVSGDYIIVPAKHQFRKGVNPFVEGQEYYSTLIHEMAHSTGAENRLNREMKGGKSTKDYAKEELVAELTSAFICQRLGFDKKILQNNAAYLKGWLRALRNDPQEIVSSMRNVNAASEMILNKMEEQRKKIAELSEEKKQTSEAHQEAPVEHLHFKESATEEEIESIQDNKKFRLDETDRKIEYGRTFYRIVALKDFADVKAGDKGGYVESEDNLSQDGNSWVYDNAIVWDKAFLFGDAKVSGFSQVYGNAKVGDRARVEDFVRISGSASVLDSALINKGVHIYNYSQVSGNAIVTDRVRLFDNAQVRDNAEIHGDAKIYDNAIVKNFAGVFGDARVFGDAEISDYANVFASAKVSGNARVKDNSVVGYDAILKGNVSAEGNARIYVGTHEGNEKIDYLININSLYESKQSNRLRNQDSNSVHNIPNVEQSSSEQKEEERSKVLKTSIPEDGDLSTNVAGAVRNLIEEGNITMDEAVGEAMKDVEKKRKAETAQREAAVVAAEETKAKENNERLARERKQKAIETAEAGRRSEKERRENDKTDVAIVKFAISSTLLLAALEAAKANKGVWLNKAGKSSAEFINLKSPITPYNHLMMSLHSDKNGYKSNIYTYGDSAIKAGMPMNKGEKALPFNWVDWKYQHSATKEVITKNEYNELSDDTKKDYTIHGIRTQRNIFNIDQTLMQAKNHDGYIELLKSRGEQREILPDDFSHNPIMLEKEFNKRFAKTINMFSKEDNTIEAYGQSANFLAKQLLIPIDKVSVGKKEVNHVKFPDSMLEKAMNVSLNDDRRVSLIERIDAPELIKSLPNPDKVINKAIEMASETAKAMGVKFERVNVLQDDFYNEADNKLTVSDFKRSDVASRRTDALEKANEIYRNLVAMTGSEKRLDRMGRYGLLPQDELKYEKLVQELAAGVLMTRQGLPATISKENRSLIPYWERELYESPKKLEAIIERDVNNAVEVIDKNLRGVTLNYEAIRNRLPMKQEMLTPKEYGVTEMLSNFPNEKSKEVVIVKDVKNGIADVILPKGASLEMGKEISGIRKDRIATALHKEGVKDVNFFNSGGDFALKQKDSYFRDKEVSLARLKQYEFVERRPLEVQSKIKESKEVVIEKFTHLKNEKGHYELFIKPQGEPSFAVEMVAEQRQKYFALRKEANNNVPSAQKALSDMAKYYYNIATEKPEIKHDLIMPKVPENIDMTKIVRPTISKDENGNKYVMATINNKFEKAPVTNEQWHKMWLADDMPAYKRAVAAVSFAPKILQSQEVEKKEEQVAETENMDNTQAKKYRLDETDRIDFYDHTLYRIIALKDFSDVKAGDKGGYVESEDNLSHDGDAWIYDKAHVAGNAKVRDNAQVSGDTEIHGYTQIAGNARVSGYGELNVDDTIKENVVLNFGHNDSASESESLSVDESRRKGLSR